MIYVIVFENLLGFFYKISFFLPSNILKMLYFSMVYPKILYAIEIYANTYQIFLHDLMILNNRVLRILQKSNRLTHTQELYYSFNTLPIDKLHKLRLLQHAHALINNSPQLPSLFLNNTIFNNEVHDHNIRSKADFHRAGYHTSIGSKSTTNSCSILWNSLPKHLKNIPSEFIFKKEIMKFLRHDSS